MSDTPDTRSRKKLPKRRYLTDTDSPTIPKTSRRRWLETEFIPFQDTASDSDTQCQSANDDEHRQRPTTTTEDERVHPLLSDANSEVTAEASTSDVNVYADSDDSIHSDSPQAIIQDIEPEMSYDQDYFSPEADVGTADLSESFDDSDNDCTEDHDDADSIYEDCTDERTIPNADEYLHQNSEVTKGQAVVTLIAFILRHHLTSAAVKDLLEMFGVFYPGSLPSSQFLLTKGIIDENVCYDAHLFCPVCDMYLGKFTECENLTNCESCEEPLEREGCLKNGSFFLYIPIENQLRHILRRHKMVKKSDFLGEDDLVGTFSGRMMKRYVQSGEISDNDITLMWNCDGAPVFRSSKRSIWPLQACLNEIEVNSKDNCLLVGLWFAKEKPWSKCYLKPFVDELKHLGTVGMKWTNDSNELVHSRVYSVCSSCDSCARPMFKNTTQFNGKFGCDWCLQEGEVIERGNGSSRIYPLHENLPEKRKFCSFMNDALSSSESDPINGVKGISPLLFLPKFDIVRGFVPDYLHCVLLGVVRMFTGLWFDSQNHQKNWYIGHSASDVSHRLINMKPPCSISRLPRTISERKFWKGSEWKSFLLYYSLIVLHGTLSPQYLNHWFLLVFSINLLLQDRVSLVDVDVAERVLKVFVRDVPSLYGREYCTFNVHQLLHLPDAVRDWGPLWVFSCFRFEGTIGQILSLVRGTKCVPMQICKTFLLQARLPKLHDQYFSVCDMHLHSFYNSLQCSGAYVRRRSVIIDNVHLYGSAETRDLYPAESLAISRLYGEDPKVLQCNVYNRFSYNSMYLCSIDHKPSNRHNDSTVQLTNGDFCVVLRCIVGKFMCNCQTNCIGGCEKVLLLLNSVEKSNDRQLGYNNQLHVSSDRFMLIGIQSPITLCIKPSMLLRKCFRYNRNDKHYIIPLPTSQELDK